MLRALHPSRQQNLAFRLGGFLAGNLFHDETERVAGVIGGGIRLGGRGGLLDDADRLARHEPARVAVLAAARFPHDLPAALPVHSVVQRVPLLFGSRLVVLDVWLRAHRV